MPRYQDTLAILAKKYALSDASTPTVDKHPYTPALRVQADYSQAQKDLIKTYNSMRNKLLEAGLMQNKS